MVGAENTQGARGSVGGLGKRRGGTAPGGGLLVAALTGLGFAPAEDALQRSGLERADGARSRTQRAITWVVPREAEAAWARFRAAYPDRGWRAQWDADTAVPTRVFGRGIRFAGASKDPAIAAAAARTVLGAHLDLFAPGATESDLQLVANHYDPDSGLRSVGFRQRHHGYPIRGGQLGVRIRADRVFVLASEAIPTDDAPWIPRESAGLDPQHAIQLARAYMGSVSRAPARVDRVEKEPVLLPVFPAHGRPELRLVQEVVLRYETPAARWSVFIALDGAPVAREQTLMFFEASLQLEVPHRFPANGHQVLPAAELDLHVDGRPTATDSSGRFAWVGSEPAVVEFGASGAHVRVENAAGSSARFELTATDGSRPILFATDDESVDAQLAAYQAADSAVRYVERIAPGNRFVTDAVVETHVNLNDSCNAFSDGRTINFFRADDRCENTALLADVVAHEYGHAVHVQSVVPGVGRFDPAMSEGAADYLAATMMNDSGMGRGFFKSRHPLRELDPIEDLRWPEDVGGDPHTTGLILGGALWDLRKSLITKLGPVAGVEHADHLWYQALRRSVDIPTSFVEILAADDDDGNLDNGTPSFCEIVDAFERHGLADPDLGGGAVLGSPVLEGRRVTIPVTNPRVSCPGAGVAGAQVFWRRRSNPAVGGRFGLRVDGDLLYAELPAQPAGEVLQFRVEVTLASGELIRLPANAASPYYERFVGEVEPIYCTDFETDPWADGWSHALVEGTAQEGADDWAWGVPAGTPGSGDPDQAASGDRVVGNDLGGANYNGRYQANKTNELRSPVFAVQGYSMVRLQYRRWLSVEDGFYDQAEIRADDEVVWRNSSSGQNGETHHEDAEWRFHDVDLTDQAADGQVQVSFRLTSDGGLELGGWTIDDVCLVGVRVSEAVCGNGVVEGDEVCDDGNQIAFDGCEIDCTESPKPGCGDGRLDEGEMCDDGNLAAGDGCESNCTFTPEPSPSCPQGGRPPCETALLEHDELPEEGCGCSATEPTAPAGPWAGALVALWVGLVRKRRA